MIAVRDVWKVYRMGGVEYAALRGVSLEVPQGTFQCVVGPSGSGKSTLLHLIGGLDRPDKGEILVGGIPLNAMNDDELANFRNRNIGFVFQMFYLVPRMSALENVELPLIVRGVPRRERRRKALEALAKVGLLDKADRKPTQLSGGEQQRVAIARAIVSEPQVLLADEPTGNLDSENAAVVMSIFRNLVDMGMTIVMVTHNVELLSYCDVTAYMRDGRIIKVEGRD